MAGSLHGDVAVAIGAQVEQMILQAKKDSEARVRHDLSVAKSQLQHMESIVIELSGRVARCVDQRGPGASEASETVDRTLLSQKISQLEGKWGSEVKALKQDLHRTILAHNHNSDLMRHHRDALDEAKRKVDAMTQPISEQVDVQIDKVERILRAGQAKQRALDALTERLAQLEAQVGEMLPSASMAGYPGAMPGMPGLKPPTEDAHKTFNAEAPVFVPRAVAAVPEAAAGAQEAEEAAGGVAEAVAKAALPVPSGGPPGLEPVGDAEKDNHEESASAEAQEQAEEAAASEEGDAEGDAKES